MIVFKHILNTICKLFKLFAVYTKLSVLKLFVGKKIYCSGCSILNSPNKFQKAYIMLYIKWPTNPVQTTLHLSKIKRLPFCLKHIVR